MGAWTIVAPAERAASTRVRVFSSMPVFSMTSSTAPCSAPPSEVKSFWNSISTTAVVFGSTGTGGSFRRAGKTQSTLPPTRQPPSVDGDRCDESLALDVQGDVGRGLPAGDAGDG